VYKRATKVSLPEQKTFTKPNSYEEVVAKNEEVRSMLDRNKFGVSEAEIEAALKNPRYRYKERVAKQIDKGRIRHDAERIVRNTIATKELPDDRPHIHIVKKGEAHFVCGDVAFAVDTKDLNKVIGANREDSPLDRLMDSQLAAICQQMGMKTEPFVRELVRDPINHLVQWVWLRDIGDPHIKFNGEHLEKNIHLSLDRYHKALLSWSPSAESRVDAKTGQRVPRAPRSEKSILMSKTFQVVAVGSKSEPHVASGRESDLLKAAQTFKGKSFTFAELSVAAQKFLKTKQDWDMICLRFLKELIGHGAVKEVTA
jgi:hypothetical protein